MDCDNQETEATKTIGSTDVEKVLKKLKNKHTKESIILLDYIDKLEKEKEKNKALETEYLIQRDLINADFLKDYIHKDKIQKIVDECIPKKENIFTGELEYTTNANANSFLAQEILKLLNKE